jgi:hypothetical protein
MAEKKEIDFWTIESSIYPKLDAMGMKRRNVWKNQRFDFGAGQILDLSISSKNGSPVELHKKFGSSDIDFKMNFRSGCNGWFRVDNQAHDYLHIHLESGAQSFDDKIKLQETVKASQLISDVFAKAEEIVKWKFPDFKISCGSDFLGGA